MQLILLFFIIFEVICVISIFAKLSLNVLTFLTICVFLLMVIIAIRKNTINLQILSNKYFNPLSYLVIFLIFIQVFFVTTYRHTDNDDAWYLGTSVATYETGTLFQYSPNTGDPMELSVMKDYVLSPLPIFWAVLAQIFHIHPLIIAHTIMPGIIILSAYWIYWKMGLRLFKKEIDACLFVLFINILNLFGYYTTRTMGTFLLLRPWQGKAIFYCIMIPLLFYYFLGLLEEKNINLKSKNLNGIYLTMGAATLASFSAVTLMPLLLGALAITYAFYKRDIRIPLRICMGMILNIILIMVYIFVL